jgi:hypothetical protein
MIFSMTNPDYDEMYLLRREKRQRQQQKCGCFYNFFVRDK